MTASPRAARDRLLQALDRHNNVCNMAVVLDVMSFLEKYPITKEALEETRLGKIINDIRRKTQNPELAKRAKSLVRSWQKLIQPIQASTRTDRKASWAFPQRVHCPNISSSFAPSSGKTVCELNRDFNNTAEKAKTKRKMNHNVQSTELSKTTPDKGHHLKMSNTSNGISQIKALMKASERHSNKPLSTSLLLKASVIQQQAATRRQRSRKRSKRQPSLNEDTSQTSSEFKSLGNQQQTFDPLIRQVEVRNEDKVEHDGFVFESKGQEASNSLELPDWKDLSTSESVQAYLNHQTSVSFALSKSCSSEECDVQTSLKDSPQRCDFPGARAEVRAEDVERLHTQRWAGVNGCFDTHGSWSDWTQSVFMDEREDGSRLEVLPYVCLD